MLLRTESRARSRFAGRRVHFIGIGGCGMSGLARMLLDSGAIVSGSEPVSNQQTFELSRRGVKISRTQMGELLSRQVDLVVRTAAVPDDNSEFAAACALGVPHIKYAEMLGQVMQERLGVAVAGTHGKSTTTAMISHALLACGADPSFVVGGTAPQLGGGSRSGAGPAFVAEACEFDRSFHHLRPTVGIITNIEEDHLDCYRDIGEIIEAFRVFAELVPGDGVVIANGQDMNVRRALEEVDRPIWWVGLEGDNSGTDVPPVRVGSEYPGPLDFVANQHGRDTRATVWTSRPEVGTNGCWAGQVFWDGQPVARLRLSVPGEHNLYNATMAVAACAALGVEPAAAAEAIGQFRGVDRRMTEMGRYNGALIVDDYGHHPTEIRATLRALRERYQPRRLICVFQPHQYSRTRFLLEDFAASFTEADETIVPDIYFVRDSEAERQRVSSVDLVARIRQHGQEARHIPDFPGIVEHLRHDAAAGDLIVTMGAGNVWEIGEELVQ